MRYLGKMDKMCVKFMEDIFKMDPKARLTALEALKHPYFKGLNGEFLREDRAARSPNRSSSKKGN